MFNSAGEVFRVTTFGESHGSALGCVVDGCPAGVDLDMEKLLTQLARRRPGQSKITTSRNESDSPEILSGVFEGITLGTPIAMIVRNKEQRSQDYETIRKNPRKGHADQTWKDKFTHVDYRGGGRSSGRETVSRVMAGWIAEAYLKKIVPELNIVAAVSSVGDVALPPDTDFSQLTRSEVDRFSCRCPEEKAANKIEAMLLKAKEVGESYGGSVRIMVRNLPKGIGEPVFHKLQNRMVNALASIGTVNGVYWNQKPVNMPGSLFHKENSYGGVNGGISNGSDLAFTVLCKPVSTLGKQATSGRHDPCVLPRIVPVVESMAAIVIADLLLLSHGRTV
jgi:chorismate synthase